MSNPLAMLIESDMLSITNNCQNTTITTTTTPVHNNYKKKQEILHLTTDSMIMYLNSCFYISLCQLWRRLSSRSNCSSGPAGRGWLASWLNGLILGDSFPQKGETGSSRFSSKNGC